MSEEPNYKHLRCGHISRIKEMAKTVIRKDVLYESDEQLLNGIERYVEFNDEDDLKEVKRECLMFLKECLNKKYLQVGTEFRAKDTAKDRVCDFLVLDCALSVFDTDITGAFALVNSTDKCLLGIVYSEEELFENLRENYYELIN